MSLYTWAHIYTNTLVIDAQVVHVSIFVLVKLNCSRISVWLVVVVCLFRLITSSLLWPKFVSFVAVPVKNSKLFAIPVEVFFMGLVAHSLLKLSGGITFIELTSVCIFPTGATEQVSRRPASWAPQSRMGANASEISLWLSVADRGRLSDSWVNWPALT